MVVTRDDEHDFPNADAPPAVPRTKNPLAALRASGDASIALRVRSDGGEAAGADEPTGFLFSGRKDVYVAIKHVQEGQRETYAGMGFDVISEADLLAQMQRQSATGGVRKDLMQTAVESMFKSRKPLTIVWPGLEIPIPGAYGRPGPGFLDYLKIPAVRAAAADKLADGRTHPILFVLGLIARANGKPSEPGYKEAVLALRTLEEYPVSVVLPGISVRFLQRGGAGSAKECFADIDKFDLHRSQFLIVALPDGEHVILRDLWIALGGRANIPVWQDSVPAGPFSTPAPPPAPNPQSPARAVPPTVPPPTITPGRAFAPAFAEDSPAGGFVPIADFDAMFEHQIHDAFGGTCLPGMFM